LTSLNYNNCSFTDILHYPCTQCTYQHKQIRAYFLNQASSIIFIRGIPIDVNIAIKRSCESRYFVDYE